MLVGMRHMIGKLNLDRINELARASKERELSEAEKTEQAALRAEYLAKFRESFRAQLENIELVDGEAGSPASVEKKN